MRVDLVVNDYAIELKIPTRRQDLQRLLGQARDYVRAYGKDHVIALIVDVGAIKDLGLFTSELVKSGVYPVVIKGTLKKKSR